MTYRYRNPVPWWRFWNPSSGLPGGLIAGAVFMGLFFLPALLALLT